MKSKIVDIQAKGEAVLKHGTFTKSLITLANGNAYTFLSKGEFKKDVGDVIDYEVTNEEYGTAKIIYTMDKPRDNDINITTDSAGDTLTNEAYLQIPSHFHEAIVYRAIAMGYKDPRNFDIEKAQYFEMEYEKAVKEGKKFARSNYQTTGIISPQEF